MATDCVLDLSELSLPYQNPSGARKINDSRYKKLLMYKIKVSAKVNQRHKNIFPHNIDWEIPQIVIYIDLLSFNSHLLSVFMHCAYHQISDYEIYTALTTIW